MKIFLRMLPILILTALVGAFFFPLFWPVSMIITTPDQFMSDILHLAYPLKYLLSESLKQNQLPLWTDLVGTGFPLIGQGQIHAFSIVNLILFKFFPAITAFNLQYVVVFLGLTTGMYLVIRTLGWSKLTGLFCAVVYGFSGLHIVKILHDDCLQALFYVPFIFWILLSTHKNKNTKLWLLLPFLISQQILQGHYQYVFMTIISLGLYTYLSWWVPKKEDRPWLIKRFLAVGVLSLGLASIQLIPSLEYFIKTGGRADLAANPIGPLTVRHLLQFFSPYALGDIRIGTYPALQFGIGFHETFSYIGIIPILFALSSLFFIRKNIWIRTVWILIGILLLLAFEKNSPIYFLYSFPPFSWFRVHSRFLAFITFFLVLLSGFCFHTIEKKFKKTPIIILCIFLVSMIDILSFAWNYHVKLPITDVQKIPELFTDMDTSTRILPFPASNMDWYKYMSTNGWKNPEEYLYFLNAGQPDYTILQNVPNLSVYAGFLPKKQTSLLSLSLTGATLDTESRTATLSALSLLTLRLHNTGILISPYHISNPEMTRIRTIQPTNNTFLPLHAFALSGVKPTYYLTNLYKKVQFIEEYTEEADQNNALDRYDAFITTPRTLIPSEAQGTISLISDTQTKKTFSVAAPEDTFFIASLYFYPGWEAIVDGKKTVIEPANISGMAIFIPQGKHDVTLRFISKSLIVGGVIVCISWLCYLGIFFYSIRDWRLRRNFSNSS